MKEFNRRVRILVRITPTDAPVAESIMEEHGWRWASCDARHATHSIDVLLYGAKFTATDAGVRLLLNAVHGHAPVEVLEARLVDSRTPARITYKIRRSGLGLFGRSINPLHWQVMGHPDEIAMVTRRRVVVSPLAPRDLKKFSIKARTGPRRPRSMLRHPAQFVWAGLTMILVFLSGVAGYRVANGDPPWWLLGLLVVAYPLGLLTSNNRQRRKLVHWGLGLPFPIIAAAAGAMISLNPQLEGGIWPSLLGATALLAVVHGIQHLWVAGVSHLASKLIVLAGALGLVVKVLTDMMTVHAYTDWLGIPVTAALPTLISQAVLIGPLLLTTAGALLLLLGILGWYRYLIPDAAKEFGAWVLVSLVVASTALSGVIGGTTAFEHRAAKVQAGQEPPGSVGIITTPVCATPTRPSIKVDGLDLDFTRVLQQVPTTDGRVWLWDVTNPVGRTARVGAVAANDVTLRRATNQTSCS